MKFNTASQYVYLRAWNTTSGNFAVPRTGDAGNITAYVALNGSDENAATNSVEEVDATNCPGVYRLELTAAELNADSVLVTAISSTGSTTLTHVELHPVQWSFNGVTFEDAIIAIMAILFGVVTIAGRVASFKKRDGTTEKVSVTSDTSGNRSASSLTAE